MRGTPPRIPTVLWDTTMGSIAQCRTLAVPASQEMGSPDSTAVPALGRAVPYSAGHFTALLQAQIHLKP